MYLSYFHTNTQKFQQLTVRRQGHLVFKFFTIFSEPFSFQVFQDILYQINLIRSFLIKLALRGGHPINTEYASGIRQGPP